MPTHRLYTLVDALLVVVEALTSVMLCRLPL